MPIQVTTVAVGEVWGRFNSTQAKNLENPHSKLLHHTLVPNSLCVFFRSSLHHCPHDSVPSSVGCVTGPLASGFWLGLANRKHQQEIGRRCIKAVLVSLLVLSVPRSWVFQPEISGPIKKLPPVAPAKPTIILYLFPILLVWSASPSHRLSLCCPHLYI